MAKSIKAKALNNKNDQKFEEIRGQAKRAIAKIIENNYTDIEESLEIFGRLSMAIFLDSIQMYIKIVPKFALDVINFVAGELIIMTKAADDKIKMENLRE